MFGLIAAALALTCLCLHAVQRGATDDENDLKYKYLWQRQWWWCRICVDGLLYEEKKLCTIFCQILPSWTWKSWLIWRSDISRLFNLHSCTSWCSDCYLPFHSDKHAGVIQPLRHPGMLVLFLVKALTSISESFSREDATSFSDSEYKAVEVYKPLIPKNCPLSPSATLMTVDASSTGTE